MLGLCASGRCGVGVVVCELEAKQGTLAELSLQGI